MPKQIVIKRTEEMTFDIPAEWEKIITNKELNKEENNDKEYYNYWIYGGCGNDYSLVIEKVTKSFENGKEIHCDSEEITRFKGQHKIISETKRVIKKKMD